MNDQGLTDAKIKRLLLSLLILTIVAFISGWIGGGIIWEDHLRIIEERSIFRFLACALLIFFFPMFFINLLSEKKTKIVYISAVVLGLLEGGAFTLFALALASI
ncbi:ACR3 family arsenite efflux pump ArsB [Puniceicoccus vermicola]